MVAWSLAPPGHFFLMLSYFLRDAGYGLGAAALDPFDFTLICQVLRGGSGAAPRPAQAVEGPPTRLGGCATCDVDDKYMGPSCPALCLRLNSS